MTLVILDGKLYNKGNNTWNRSFKFSVSVYLQNWNNNLPPASVTVAVTITILIALKKCFYQAKRNDIHYLVKNKIKQNLGLRLAAMYFIRHVQ